VSSAVELIERADVARQLVEPRERVVVHRDQLAHAAGATTASASGCR
jgi:hypothetical protein